MTIIPMPSPNQASRNGVVITDIVLHWMDGNLAAADATFANAAGQTSAHYGIENNTIHQYVDDSRVAWHSGDWNENQRSIGIEHSAQPGRDASVATIATSVALIVSLCRAHNISPDHIYPHNRFYSTQCPGTLPLAAMIASVRAQLGKPVPPSPTPPAPSGHPAYIGYPVWMGHCSAFLAKMIQTRLSIPADGNWGPITQSAVLGFQRAHGLTVDGVVGAITWKALWP
jgi:hypothetical protein